MIAATTSDTAATPLLPRPLRERWQPLRGGLLNLYRYDAQEFRYEDGRLLLRGNNGTGKSRVLALQLPFLLDGEVAPHRLEPDRDPAKRVEWNLLMGRHKDRTGYTWIEFGRRDADGREHYVTLGCGLAAVEGRGLVGKWFFVTSRRVGHDLFLQSAAGHPVSRERLSETLVPDKEVFRTAAAYRDAVDAALFRLGTHRYQALVDLLIQLRQPQLSRQLDEAQLSRALSEALPPVPDAVVGDVADAFRSLEADRAALDAYAAASNAVESFLAEYRRYAQVAARRRAEVVRRAHAAYEATGRRLAAAERDLVEATSAESALAKALLELATEEAAARAAEVALATSPEMAGVRELQRTREAADRCIQGARLAAEDLERTHVQRVHADGLAREAEERHAETHREVEAEAARATEAAAGAALGVEHDRAVARLRLPEGPDDAARLDAARRITDEAGRRRIGEARHLRDLNQKLGEARAERAAAKSAQTELAAQLDAARDAERAAQETLAATIDALIADWRAWAAGVRELAPRGADEIADQVREWATSAAGESPTAVAARRAASAAEEGLVSLLADAAQRRTIEQRALDEFLDERARLVAGEHRPPPVPHTRDVAVRAGRPGAPLWLLCDFRPGVDDRARAGLEAALEASGILDAWVTPDGELLAPGVHDSVIVAGRAPRVDGDAHLGSLLAPSIDRDDPSAAAVADEAVAAILARIGARAGAGDVWVDPDGRWRVGPLHGAWSKPAAEHVGQASREQGRRKRLAALDVEIAAVRLRIAGIDGEISSVEERRTRARAEAEAAPGDAGVRGAVALVTARAAGAEEARRRVSAAEERVLERRRALDAAEEKRDGDARDLGLSAWAEDPSRLEDAVNEYLHRTAALWPAVRAHMDATRSRGAALDVVRRATTDEERRARLLDEAKRAEAAAVSDRDVLEASVGATESEIVGRLDEARRRCEALRKRREEGDDARVKAAKRVGEVDGVIAGLGETLRGETTRRAAAIDAFAAFVATKLLGTAASSLADVDSAGWSDTRAVEVARRTEEALTSVEADDAAWERTQKEIHRHVEALKDALLPYGYSPVTTIEDGIFVVEVPFQGRACTMRELREALVHEVGERKRLLDAREREVLENYLVGEASLQLHELLRRGEELVGRMNDELRKRPTSTGMTLRFVWNPVEDGPAGLERARRQLLRAGATWSPAERQALGEFLHARIREIRAERIDGTWKQHLAAALDYRAWHVFSVERCQDGQWKRLTKRTHGTGSGGEKAVALTVPQFAAAAAHYRSADPNAPRLILLDEAFVGIDGDMRSKCMGLLAAFDLDFVMTSEREWGCYPTVPGVAIYQLATAPGIDAVGVTRWVWNGRERVRDLTEAPSVVEPADGRHAASPGSSNGRAHASPPDGPGESASDATGA